MYGLPSPKDELHISLGAAKTQHLHLVFISCHIKFSITHIFTQVFVGLIMAYSIARMHAHTLFKGLRIFVLDYLF